MEFERPHHQAIATVLYALDGQLLRDCSCLFGGGTAIALRCGEYRESIDMDFLVSDIAGYRQLRTLLTGGSGIAALLHAQAPALKQDRDIRADQYGIRTALAVSGRSIKFEIVFEARISLVPPSPEDALCNIATLVPLDVVASKLLANSDHWRDDGVFSRDALDLAMLAPALPLLRQATEKAKQAYGDTIVRDLQAALHSLLTRPGWMERCMQAMSINVPKAVLWKKVRSLHTRAQKLVV